MTPADGDDFGLVIGRRPGGNRGGHAVGARRRESSLARTPTVTAAGAPHGYGQYDFPSLM